MVIKKDFVGWKVRDKKTGKYVHCKTGLDSLNVSVGYVNGNPVPFTYSQLAAESLKSDDKKSDC